MQDKDKYIKDLTLALVVIALIVFGFRNYYLYTQVSRVPAESRYTALALDADLLNQIQQIEVSIRERQEFTFGVDRDPLRQDLVIQTRMDLIAEWEEMVRQMMRVSATFIDSEGNRKAIIAWNGLNNVVGIGDVLNNRRIVEINDASIAYTEGGRRGVIALQPIPQRPAELNPRHRELFNR